MKFFRPLIGFAFASLLLAAGSANAQNQAAAPPKPLDTQLIGDWTIRCFPVKSVSPCDMFEQFNDKHSHQLVLAVSIAYLTNADRYAIQIVVPLGIAIAKGVVIQTSTFTSPALPYRRCDRTGCYIQQLIDNASINSLAHADPNAKVKIVADNGRAFDLPFSLKGFAEAHNSMVSLAKQKAAKPGDKTAPGPAAAPAKK